MELEKYKAPRSLSEQQKDDIRNGLSQIAISPREIDALICGETAEISNISEVIISLLEQSGWDVRVCRPLGEFVTGILIVVRAGSDASTNSAADVIVGLLSNCELTVEKTEFHDGEGGISLVSSSTSGQTTEAAMRIIIGAKW